MVKASQFRKIEKSCQDPVLKCRGSRKAAGTLCRRSGLCLATLKSDSVTSPRSLHPKP